MAEAEAAEAQLELEKEKATIFEKLYGGRDDITIKTTYDAGSTVVPTIAVAECEEGDTECELAA